jgi:hypothetical protein
MRNSHLAVILGVWLALAACSKSTQEKTDADLKAVGHDAAAAAKDVANAPAAKELGSDLKAGTQEAAAKAKVAADEAGDKLKSGTEEAGDKLKAGTDKAAAKTDAAVDKAKEKADQH